MTGSAGYAVAQPAADCDVIVANITPGENSLRRDRRSLAVLK